MSETLFRPFPREPHLVIVKNDHDEYTPVCELCHYVGSEKSVPSVARGALASHRTAISHRTILREYKRVEHLTKDPAPSAAHPARLGVSDPPMIPFSMRDEMISHARHKAPEECCGIIGFDGEYGVRLYRARNAAPTPFKNFIVDARDQFAIECDLARRGLTLGATYHSHPTTEPSPSSVDVRNAIVSELCLIVGLDPPEVRAYRITKSGNLHRTNETVTRVDLFDGKPK